ncbi:AMP-binding protein, partial [Bacillus sp. GMa5/2]
MKSIQKKLGRETKIYNEYGPTETVVGCMIHQFDIEKDKGISVPIGVPAQNMKIYVLDSDLRPVPMGGIGEIYISGEGVARGYFNNQDLTRERFIVNPYSAKEKMYKSGDLARFIEGDKIEYLGRKDDQVKVRGFRIELKEIEINLQKHPSIKEVVVIDQEDYDGNRYLCAYYIENVKVKTSELFRFLQEILPVYMIPSYFIVLKEIPLTFNGKLDREALPKPEIKIEKKTEGEIESDLVGIIREVLNVEKVSIRDNFYHLGGDSIKAIQISSKIREKGIKIKTKDILANPVIEDMVLYLEMNSTKEQKSNQQCVGSIETIPSIAWFFSKDLNNINHYTQSVLVKVKDDIEVGILESAFSLLVCHHDAFRLNYR